MSISEGRISLEECRLVANPAVNEAKQSVFGVTFRSQASLTTDKDHKRALYMWTTRYGEVTGRVQSA